MKVRKRRKLEQKAQVEARDSAVKKEWHESNVHEISHVTSKKKKKKAEETKEKSEADLSGGVAAKEQHESNVNEDSHRTSRKRRKKQRKPKRNQKLILVAVWQRKSSMKVMLMKIPIEHQEKEEKSRGNQREIRS